MVEMKQYFALFVLVSWITHHYQMRKLWPGNNQQHRIVVITALRDLRIIELVKTIHIHLDQVGR